MTGSRLRRLSSSRPPGGEDPRAHVYLLLGDEDVRVDTELQRILDSLLPASERALNLDVVDGAELPVQEIINRCEMYPFFGARRVVVLRRAEALRAADQDALASYLEQGPPPTALVVVAGSLDRRRRLYGVLQRVGRVIPCGALGERDVMAWIRERAKEEGKAIAPDAARLLALLVGTGLRELGLELAKLAAYVGERPLITAADVRTAASRVAEATVFDLVDAVGRRDRDAALRLLQTVLALGEPPVRVLYLLADQFRMLVRTEALVTRWKGVKKIPEPEVREALGARAWLFPRYREQLEALGRLDPVRLFALLLDSDTALKTGVMPPRLALELLIVRLCEAPERENQDGGRITKPEPRPPGVPPTAGGGTSCGPLCSGG